MTEQHQHRNRDRADDTGTALDDEQLLAAAHVLGSFPQGSRLRRLVATGLDAGVIEIGDAMALEHQELQQLLEQAVTEGRLAEPRPYPAPAPTHHTDGRRKLHGQALLDAVQVVRLLPADLQDPASSAIGQGVVDVDELRWVDHDRLREVLRAAVAAGRLVNELHAEDPEVFPAWSL